MVIAELAFAREVPENVVLGQELRKILVATHDRRRPTYAAPVLDECADQVIGLIQGIGTVHQSQRADEAPALRELSFQFLRRRFTIRLVLRVDAGTKGRRQAFIERDGDVLGIDLLDKVAQEPGKAIERVDGVAVGVDYVVGHRIISPEYVYAGVDQVLHRRSIAEPRNVRCVRDIPRPHVHYLQRLI